MNKKLIGMLEARSSTKSAFLDQSLLSFMPVGINNPWPEGQMTALS